MSHHDFAEACEGLEAHALSHILARHGRDVYAHVTLGELKEMVEEEVLRLCRRDQNLRAAA